MKLKPIFGATVFSLFISFLGLFGAQASTQELFKTNESQETLEKTENTENTIELTDFSEEIKKNEEVKEIEAISNKKLSIQALLGKEGQSGQLQLDIDSVIPNNIIYRKLEEIGEISAEQLKMMQIMKEKFEEENQKLLNQNQALLEENSQLKKASDDSFTKNYLETAVTTFKTGAVLFSGATTTYVTASQLFWILALVPASLTPPTAAVLAVSVLPGVIASYATYRKLK